MALTGIQFSRRIKNKKLQSLTQICPFILCVREVSFQHQVELSATLTAQHIVFPTPYAERAWLVCLQCV